MKSNEPQQTDHRYTGNFVVGTAFKAEENDEGNSKKTVKIVGQAVQNGDAHESGL